MLNKNKYFTTCCGYFVVSLGQQHRRLIFEACMQVKWGIPPPFWFPEKGLDFLFTLKSQNHERKNGKFGFLTNFYSSIYTVCGCCFICYKEWVNSSLISHSLQVWPIFHFPWHFEIIRMSARPKPNNQHDPHR